MLNNKRCTITAESIVDGRRLAVYSAILDLDKTDLSITDRQINAEACMPNAKLIREDKTEFEDIVYMVRDQLKNPTVEGA